MAIHSFSQSKIRPAYTRLVFLISMLIFSVHAYLVHEPFKYGRADPGWMVAAADSLANDLDLDLKNQMENDPDRAAVQTAIGKNGEWFPIHEPLLAFFAAPFFYAFGPDGCLYFNILISAVLIVMAYRLYTHFASDSAALSASVLLASTSLFLYYSYSFSIDVLGAMFATIALLCLVEKRIFTAGFFCGATFLARIIYWPLFPIFTLYTLMVSRSIKQTVLIVAGMSIGIVIFLLGNLDMYGGILTLAYYRQGFAVNGELVLSSEPFFHVQSPLAEVTKFLVDKRQSFLVGMPILVLTLPFGIAPALRAHRQKTTLLFSIWLVMTAWLLSREGSFPGEWGNRYLMLCYVIAGTFVAAALDRFFNDGSKRSVEGP